MKAMALGIVIALLLVEKLIAQQDPADAGQGQPPQVLASVEARWEHVYCDLTELRRTGTGELSVRFQYRNTKQEAHKLPHANLVLSTMAFDPVNSSLFGVLQDASGKAISSTMLDGAAARPIPGAATQAHWARLQAPPDSVSTVTLLVEGCLPFEDATIGGMASRPLRVAPEAVIATQDSETPGLVVELTGVNRHPGGFATVTFRYRNTGSSVYKFPHERHIRNAYFLDNANRKKYEVVRDAEQRPLCSENLAPAGQVGDTIDPLSAINIWAKFASPPESTGTVTVMLPFAPPFDDVPVSGAGEGAVSAGSSVAGSVVGVDAALQDLGATVSATEIRIELAADILFDFDKADIRQEAAGSLTKVATVLNAHPDAKVSIEGHTDAKGTDAYNQTLSEQRAASVKQWLIANGAVNGAAIVTRGWGKTKPLAHNTKPDGSDDPEGRAKNRRVEILVSKGV